MRPQSGMLWYFSPVAGIQTIAPEESEACEDGEEVSVENSSEDGASVSAEESPAE